MKKTICPSISSALNCANAEQDDLLITPYLTHNELPQLLRDVLAVANTDDQRDMLLLSSLTAISSVLPNLSFRYGVNGKRYYANMQTFIMAAAASGKSIAGVGRELVAGADETARYLIPGDSSYAAFIDQLAEQGGRGLLFETEGSVITDTWRTQARSYNTALRQAAEHETISRARHGHKTLYIDNPQLSCLITGTADQFRALVPSVQNGFFSRLTCYINRSSVGFRPEVMQSLRPGFFPTSRATVGQSQMVLARIFSALSKRKGDCTFSLTDEQVDELSSYFVRQYEPLISSLGEAFHASVIRMVVTATRIMMILAALRAAETEDLSTLGSLTATDEDFQAGQLIAGKLLLHAADAFTQIHGEATLSVPESRSAVQRLTFLAQLPDKFTTEECHSRCQQFGISIRTADYWLSSWSANGTLNREGHGVYSKCA